MKYKVLAIDDDELFCDVLVESMRQLGHEASGIHSVKDALSVLASEKFDVIITDVILPGIDGLELVIEARKRFPDLYIVAISGGGKISAEIHLENTLVNGANEVLEKPFGLDRLKEMMSRFEIYRAENKL